MRGRILAACLLLGGCHAEEPVAKAPPAPGAGFMADVPPILSETEFEARQTPKAWPKRFTLGALAGDYGTTTFEDVRKIEGVDSGLSAVGDISWLCLVVETPGGIEAVTFGSYQHKAIYSVKISRDVPSSDMGCSRIKAERASAVDDRLRLGMSRAEVRAAMGEPIYDEPGYLMFAGRGPDSRRVDNDGDVTVHFVGDRASEIYAGRSLPVD